MKKSFPQVLVSDEDLSRRETARVRCSVVYAVRFFAGGDGPFETQTLQAHNAAGIVKVLRKGGAEKIGIYQVSTRPSYQEYKLVDEEELSSY